MLDDTTVVGSMRSLSRTHKPSQKARDNEETQSTVGLTGIIEDLSRMEEQIRESSRRCEENRELKDMIKSLKLDMESMKAASPYWGQSFASQSPPLSYADIVGAGFNSSGSARVSKSVSFSDDTPSTQLSTRSILKSERAGD